MPQYVLREFRITDARDGQSRTLRQFHFMEWPDQGVPRSADGFIDFVGQVHKTKEQFGQDGPITVHCSAGVGRTGVFIGLSCILERLQYESVVDCFATVKLMRTQRPQMVQTEVCLHVVARSTAILKSYFLTNTQEQYQFLYTAALDYLSTFEGALA